MSITALQQSINKLDWNNIKNELDDHGYAVLPALLHNEDCEALISMYTNDKKFRSTIVMKRYNFGSGEYKYFSYPLPPVVQCLRETLYKPLAAIANDWYAKLNIEKVFPFSHNELLVACHQQGQQKSTPLILKYGAGDYNTLHQDLYGDVYFPLQAVIFLTEPGTDYTGGEFVLIEQRPRLQSKAIVLQPKKGDIVLFTTNFRAAKGSKGYYRAPMRHGVSQLRSGNRYNVGIIFHDAT